MVEQGIRVVFDSTAGKDSSHMVIKNCGVENPFVQKEQGVCFAVACERHVGFQPAGSKTCKPELMGACAPLADGAGECETRASSNAGEEIEEEAAEIPAVRPQAVPAGPSEKERVGTFASS